MAVYTPVSAEALETFLSGYEVGEVVTHKGIAEGVENSNFLLDTSRGRYILTLYERRVSADDLPFFIAVTDHLAARSVPAPRMVRDRAGRPVNTCEGRPACLIEFLPGLSPGRPTPAQARAGGAALAGMHRALEDCDASRPNTLGPDGWRALFARCGEALDRIAAGLHDRIGRALDATLADWPHDLPRGVIHADLFPDNVLMMGERVTGLIDFYFACTDITAYDLAVMHSAWSFDLDGRPFGPDVGAALLDGYASARPLSPAERAALPVLARGACLRFALTRAWDWLNTPADALVTRKDPMAYLSRYDHYLAHPELFA